HLPVSEFQFGGEFAWHPSPELIAQSNLQQFIDKHRLGSYDELMRRSTTDIAWFWGTVLRDLDIQFYKPYSRVVDLSGGKAWARCSRSLRSVEFFFRFFPALARRQSLRGSMMRRQKRSLLPMERIGVENFAR